MGVSFFLQLCLVRIIFQQVREWAHNKMQDLWQLIINKGESDAVSGFDFDVGTGG